MTQFGLFSDAMYFTKDEWAVLTELKLEDLIDERVATWVEYLQQPPHVITEEELVAQKLELTAKILEIEAQIAEINITLQDTI